MPGGGWHQDPIRLLEVDLGREGMDRQGLAVRREQRQGERVVRAARGW